MVSQPLLIDQHTGSAIYIETMRDDSFLNHLADAIHDYDFFRFSYKNIVLWYYFMNIFQIIDLKVVNNMIYVVHKCDHPL